MEYLSLIFLHVLFGALWAGAAVVAGLFIIPAVIEAGPAGGAVMAGVAKRGLPIAMTIAGGIVLVTGLRLFMIRYTAGWLQSPEGLVLLIGAVLATGAFVIGVFVQKPAVQRLGALSARIAASGAPPTAAEAGEIAALRQRLGKAARLTAWHLLGAAVLMAMHRWAATW